MPTIQFFCIAWFLPLEFFREEMAVRERIGMLEGKSRKTLSKDSIEPLARRNTIPRS